MSYNASSGGWTVASPRKEEIDGPLPLSEIVDAMDLAYKRENLRAVVDVSSKVFQEVAKENALTDPLKRVAKGTTLLVVGG